VPSTIVVRKVARSKAGRPPTWHRVSYFLRRRDIREWRRFTVRDGQKEPIEVLALAIRVQTRRHGRPRQEMLLAIEALGSEEPKGEAGLDHHEVRAWRGWHHHMTVSLMAPWFLVRERRRLGEEKAPLSVAMVRFMIPELLRLPLSPRQIAARCRYQMRRNEEARINHWRARGLEPPSWRRGHDLVQ
jgi:SRSO17 transposase